MSKFVPSNEHMRSALIYCFHSKKTAAESHGMLVEAYGNLALSETTCRDWFRRFENGDFDISDKDSENRPKIFNDAELQALLDQDDTQTQKKLAEQLNVTEQTVSDRLREMGLIRRAGKWVQSRSSKLKKTR